MPVRYDDDPGSGQPQIDGHNVAEDEVEAVPGRPLEDRPGEWGECASQPGKRKEAAIDASF